MSSKVQLQKIEDIGLLVYYDNKDLGEINEEIEDKGDFEERETPFESEEEALLYLKDVYW